MSKSLAPEFSRDDVELVDESIVYQGFWRLKTLRLRFRRFAGGWSETILRELHCRGDAVGVLLYDPALDAVALVEQFRVGALARPGSPWLLELVAGLIDANETPDAVARRETQEESGCGIDALIPIADYYSSPGGSDEYFHLFCGRTRLADVTPLHGHDEHEDIRLHVIPVAELPALRATGRLNNAHTLIALQWLELHREELRNAWR